MFNGTQLSKQTRDLTNAGLRVGGGTRAVRPDPDRESLRQRGVGAVSRPLPVVADGGVAPWVAARVVRRSLWPQRRPSVRCTPSGVGAAASNTPWDRGRFLQLRTPRGSSQRMRNTEMPRRGGMPPDMRLALRVVNHPRKAPGSEP